MRRRTFVRARCGWGSTITPSGDRCEQVRTTSTPMSPKEVGGGERGPDPYELLLMSLGACTSMTLRQYAKRKGYALKDVQVRLRHERAHATDCQECGDRSGQVDHVTRQLLLSGPLSESQRQDLLRIADRCPVHRTLENHPVITTTLIRD